MGVPALARGLGLWAWTRVSGLAVASGPLSGFWPVWLTTRLMITAILVVAVGCVAGWAFLRRAPMVRPLGEAGKVTAVKGRMGSGKSMFAMTMAVRQLEAGAYVATNFTMHVAHSSECQVGCKRPLFPGARWTLFRSLDDLAELKGDFEWSGGRRKCVRRVVVVIDEAQDLISADARSLPAVARFVLKNMRKNGIDLYWLTQDDGGVHKRLKSLTNEFVYCRSAKGRIFYAYFYDTAEKWGKPKRHTFVMKYKLDPRIASAYDTAEIIVPDVALMDERLTRAVKASTRRLGESGGAAPPPVGAVAPVRIRQRTAGDRVISSKTGRPESVGGGSQGRPVEAPEAPDEWWRSVPGGVAAPSP